MRKTLSSQEIDAFLNETQIGMLGTLYRDGTTLISPVSYVWVDGGFTVGVPLDDIKVRHIRRDPRVSMCVAESQPPYRGVHLRTVGQLVDDPEALAEITWAMAEEHLGEAKAATYASARTESQSLLLRIEPGELRAWDFSDVPGLDKT